MSRISARVLVVCAAVCLVVAGIAAASTSDRPVRRVPTTTTAPAVTTTTATTPPPATTAPRASRKAVRPHASPNAGPHRFGWTDDPFDALSACEAGMNPARVSASGKYRGAFQFALDTWRGIGEYGDPINYDYPHQKAAAQRLQARSGWGQWPTCSRRLGLR